MFSSGSGSVSGSFKSYSKKPANNLEAEDAKVTEFSNYLQKILTEQSNILSEKLSEAYAEYKTKLDAKPASKEKKEPSEVKEKAEADSEKGKEKPAQDAVELTKEQKIALENEYKNKKQLACTSFNTAVHRAMNNDIIYLVDDLQACGKPLKTFLEGQNTDILGLAKRFTKKDAEPVFLNTYRQLYSEHSNNLMVLDAFPLEDEVDKEMQKRDLAKLSLAKPQDPSAAQKTLVNPEEEERQRLAEMVRIKKVKVVEWVENKVEASKPKHEALVSNSKKFLDISKKFLEHLETYSQGMAGYIEKDYDLNNPKAEVPKAYDYKKIAFVVAAAAAQVVGYVYKYLDNRWIERTTYAASAFAGVIVCISAIDWFNAPAKDVISKLLIESNAKNMSEASTILTNNLKEVVAGKSGNRGVGSGSVSDVVQSMIQNLAPEVFSEVIKSKVDAEFSGVQAINDARESGMFDFKRKPVEISIL